MTITSTIFLVQMPCDLAWTGTTIGIKAIHIWQLEKRGENVVVKTQESWDGLLPRFLRGTDAKDAAEKLD